MIYRCVMMVMVVMMVQVNQLQPGVMMHHTRPDHQSKGSKDSERGTVRMHEHHEDGRVRSRKAKIEAIVEKSLRSGYHDSTASIKPFLKT